MKELNKMLKAFWTDEEGVTVVEYAVLAALIIVASLAIILTLGKQIDQAFNQVSTGIAESTGVTVTGE